MASAFSHALVAVALGTASAKERMSWQFWALSVLCAVLPDANVIGFSWGVGYNSMWGLGHRGVQIMISEFVYTWLPITLLCAAVRLYRRG
jgi:inner membrane protein